MAIGANRRNILGMVLRRGLLVALAGLAAGMVASNGAWSAIAAYVPGVTQASGRRDIVGLVLVAGVILVVTTLAALVPAYRASRIAPTEALRCE